MKKYFFLLFTFLLCFPVVGFSETVLFKNVKWNTSYLEDMRKRGVIKSDDDFTAQKNTEYTLDIDNYTFCLKWNNIIIGESYDYFRPEYSKFDSEENVNLSLSPESEDNNNSVFFTKHKNSHNIIVDLFADRASFVLDIPLNDDNIKAWNRLIAMISDKNKIEPYQSTAVRDIRNKNDLNFEVNGVKFTMIEVEGGTFTMGDNSNRVGEQYANNKPAHNVTLSSFYIAQTEVTQELWHAVMGKWPESYKGPKYPVNDVSWDDCQKFIKKLNSITGKKFRLPTEAEWEFAARGGNMSKGYKYAGSNTINDVSWYSTNSLYGTHEVATKKPNELGIYDMSGNSIEWCQDWYDYNYYKSSPSINPIGPKSGKQRVLRGGGWKQDDRATCLSRYFDSPKRDVFNGFRLAIGKDN